MKKIKIIFLKIKIKEKPKKNFKEKPKENKPNSKHAIFHITG